MKEFMREGGSGLVWLPHLGMGRYPVSDDRPYDQAYFDYYRDLVDTEMGRELTAARIAMVDRHYHGMVLDVGIGSGQFVINRTATRGYDVNPAGVDWLKRHNRWANLYGLGCRYPALTFWDSLEHIDRPDLAVARAEKWVFVSLPIFESGEHVIHSKHFRPDQHIWYWTHEGLIAWFKRQGFELAEHNTIETEIGREEISSYAFYRKE